MAKLFLVVFIPGTLFMKGMPLNRYFRPWGQLMIGVAAVFFNVLLVVSSGFLSNWWYRRKMLEFLDSPDEKD